MLQNATLLRKSAPGPPNGSDEHVSCTAPATQDASLQILLKCATPAIVCGNATKPCLLFTFDKVHNPLRLPRETASERPKVFRTCDFLKINILTSKCASRHNGVHFFGISTFKSGPRLRCFVHFDYDTCFVPQRRAFFSTSQLQKALRSSGVLYILTFAFFPFHLSKVLRLSRKGDVSSCMSE